jgi:molybdopterin molybdotransferase
MVTAQLFLVPLVHALLGRATVIEALIDAVVSVPLSANGPRAHYMRARTALRNDGRLEVTPVQSQDSSLLAPFAAADCLIVRPTGAAAVSVGGEVKILRLDP